MDFAAPSVPVLPGPAWLKLDCIPCGPWGMWTCRATPLKFELRPWEARRVKRYRRSRRSKTRRMSRRRRRSSTSRKRIRRRSTRRSRRRRTRSRRINRGRRKRYAEEGEK